jgi:hypothetical protein
LRPERTPDNWFIAKTPWLCLLLLFEEEDWPETSNKDTWRLEEAEELDGMLNSVEDDD